MKRRRNRNQLCPKVTLWGALFILTSCAHFGPKATDSTTATETTQPQASAPTPAPTPGKAPDAFTYFTLGQKALDEDNPDSAIESFKLAVVYDPDSAQSYYHLAEAYMRKQMFSEAITAVKKSISLDPGYVNAHLLLGGVFSATRMFDEAIVAYEKALKLDPTNMEARFVTAMIYAEQEKWAKSESLFREILAKDNTHYFANYYLGKILELQSKGKKAEAYYLKAIEQRPGLTPPARALSVLYEKRNDYDGLIRLYQAILRAEPDNALVKKKLAQTYLVTDKYDSAIAYFKDYIGQEKDDLNAQITYGLLQLETKDATGAEKTFKEILARYPQSDKVHFYLGMTLEGQNRIEESVDSFLRVPPESEHYITSMAHITYHLKIRDPEKALEHLTKALERRPDLAGLYDLQAQIHEHMNKLDLSLRSLQDGLRISPDDESMLYYLGVVQNKLGQHDSAVQTMERILKINANNANALNFIGYTFAEKNTRLNDAEAYVLRALKHKPNDPYILDSLGWIYFKRGNYQKAIIELEKAASLNPTEAVIYSHLAEVYLKLNLNQKANDSLRKALVYEKDENEQHRLKKRLGDINERAPATAD